MASGRFVTQNPGRPSAYRAFVPGPLPPARPIDLSTVQLFDRQALPLAR